MRYFKIVSSDGSRFTVVSSFSPTFLRYQSENNILVGCDEQFADGIALSFEGHEVCVLDGKSLHRYQEETTPVAIEISQLMYDEYISTQEQTDVEDETPVIPENVPEETILTRAELTRRITELEAQNKFLQDCILEMSEAIYG